MENHVGCYETGSLDFFGPLCVVACYVDQKDEFWLNKLNLEVTSNEEIIQLGKVLKEKLTYSLLLLDNSHYNQYVSEGQKLSCMKANLYNQAMINVIQRISYPISTKTNAFCLGIILCNVSRSFDYLIYPYYPAYTS